MQFKLYDMKSISLTSVVIRVETAVSGLTPIDVHADFVLETLNKVHAALLYQKGLEIVVPPETSAYAGDSIFGDIQFCPLDCKERHECFEN